MRAFSKYELVAKPGSKTYVHLLCGVMSETKATFGAHFFGDAGANRHNVVFWDYAERYNDQEMSDEITKYIVSCGEDTKHYVVGVSFGARVMHLAAQRFAPWSGLGKKYEVELVAITPVADYRMSKDPMLRKRPLLTLMLTGLVGGIASVVGPLRRKKFVKSSVGHPYWGSHETDPEHLAEYYAEDEAGTRTPLGQFVDQAHELATKIPVREKLPKCHLVLIDDLLKIGNTRGDWHVDYHAAKAFYDKWFDEVNLIVVESAHSRMNSWYREYYYHVFLPLELVK